MFNYLLLKLLQEPQKAEELKKDLLYHIEKNEPKKATTKEISSFISKVKHSNYSKYFELENGWYAFTDTQIAIFSKSKIKDLKAEKTSQEKIIELSSLDSQNKPILMNFTQLANYSALVGKEKEITLHFKDFELTFSAELIKQAYSFSNLNRVVRTMLKKSDKKKQPIYFYDSDNICIITPLTHATDSISLYVADNGSIHLEEQKDLADLFISSEEKEKIIPAIEKPAQKVVKHSVKEQATAKQIAYITLLLGKPYTEEISKKQASKMITDLLNKKGVAQA